MSGERSHSGVRLPLEWDSVADVVVVGAGAAGLSASISARDCGATVITLEANCDVGGRAILSSGRVALGGGTSFQKKYGIEDSADQIYLDHTSHRHSASRYGDRDLVRVWADENAKTFEFLVDNGVTFVDAEPILTSPASVPRLFIAELLSSNFQETINGGNGAGLVRALEKSARRKGVTIRLRHRLTGIVREPPGSGPVVGISVASDSGELTIRARSGVVLATGGHCGNVEFRRLFDPRLTEEYQTAGEPWTSPNADGERLAIAIGASLWATANQTCGNGFAVSKTAHIGCRWGYRALKWLPSSPLFSLAGASGLTVSDFRNLILVNQAGRRFWNELDESQDFIHACLGTNGNLGREGKANGGGSIWAIFDAEAVKREGWEPSQPHVDTNGWFFSAGSVGGLARAISNPYQHSPMSTAVLEDTVRRYNSFVDRGVDLDFDQPSPMYKIQVPPFYAAWSTPMVHESLTGLRVTPRCEVVDRDGMVITGLYCAGESAGGLAFHGLGRVLVFGRIAGREAATHEASPTPSEPDPCASASPSR